MVVLSAALTADGANAGRMSSRQQTSSVLRNARWFSEGNGIPTRTAPRTPSYAAALSTTAATRAAVSSFAARNGANMRVRAGVRLQAQRLVERALAPAPRPPKSADTSQPHGGVSSARLPRGPPLHRPSASATVESPRAARGRKGPTRVAPKIGLQNARFNALGRLTSRSIFCVTPTQVGLVLLAATPIALALGATAATRVAFGANKAPAGRAGTVERSPIRALARVYEPVNRTNTPADRPPGSLDTARPTEDADAKQQSRNSLQTA